MLHEFLTRIRFLFRRKPRREVDEELRFHLEHQAEANIAAGMSPEEARRQAAIAFGSIERAREECREERPGYWAETFLQDVRYALRGFRRNPTFTLTIVLTLMLGIGATTAVFSVVDRILFRSLPYGHADRLVSLGLVHSLETQEFMLGSFYYDWRNNQTAFESMTSESAVTRECDLSDSNPAQLRCPRIESNFLTTLGVAPILGRNFLPEETGPNRPKVALISYGLWLTHYGLEPGILNQTIDIDGNPTRIIGVLPKDFEMPRLQAADVLLPVDADEATDRKVNSGLGGPKRVYALLKPGVNIQQATAALQPLFQQTLNSIPAEIRSDVHLRIRSLRDRQMQDVRQTAWILFGVALAVLLIACANVASLLTARGVARARELAVGSALGASRARLACQSLTEAFLLAICGALAGFALAEGLLRLFVAIAPAGIPVIAQARLDMRIMCSTIAVSVVCGALTGLVPALQRPAARMLAGRSITAAAKASARQWLVVGQIAASMVLLAGATLLLRSFLNLQDQPLGMRYDNTLTVSITLGEHNYPTAEQMLTFFQQLKTRLQYGPGVSLVAVADSLPPAANANGRRHESIAVPGRPASNEGSGGPVTFRWVSPDYFNALDIPILQGLGFNEEEVTSSDHFMILSKYLATRLFPGGSAVGKRLQMDKQDPRAPLYTVVGIAANVKNRGLAEEDEPEYYLLRRNRAEDWDRNGVWGRTSVIVIRTTLPPDAISPWIRSQVAALDPALPVDIATLHQRVSKLADAPRFRAVLVTCFAATGLLLAVIGLYGVISFLVGQRTQEIGVRMALGATRADILTLVMKSGLRLILAGTFVGLLAALALSRFLSSLLFSVGTHDPFVFAIVTLLLVFVALIATLIPAASAVRVDPTVSLRCE
jgi:putative ABC transport system permease protein